MKKTLIGISFFALAATPFISFADSGPGCGLGATVWKGKTGSSAHTSAGTTNGILMNKQLGITFGTLGCDSNAVVYNDVEQKVFISNNLDNLQQEIAQGSGEHLLALAGLKGVSSNDQDAFFAIAQENYTKMFSSDSVDHETVIAVLDLAMMSNVQLAKYIK